MFKRLIFKFLMFQRSRKRLLLVALAAGLTIMLVPGSAMAATQTASPTFTGSGSQTSILSALAVCDTCAPDALFSGPFNSFGFGVGVSVQAQASWNNPSAIGMQYTAGNLRHGQTLDLSDTLTPGAGSVTVNYSVSGVVAVYGTQAGGSDESCAVVTVSNATCNGWELTNDNLTLGPVTDSDTIPCTMPLPGDSPRTCTATKSIQLFKEDFFGIASAEADLILDESVTVTGTGVTTLRTAVVSGGPSIPDKNLTFTGTSPSTVADPITISCAQPAGNDLSYSLTNIGGYTADPVTYDGDLKFHLTANVLGIGLGFTTPALLSTSGADLGPITMTAPDQQVDLGPVLANNIPPMANPGGPYSGNEGSPITFDGSGTTSVCGLGSTTLVWNFSDGGVAYGVSPQHTFEGPGVYSGVLTATDVDGNVGTATFSVTVANQPPVANAGPNTSSEWGVPVALNGSAVDPGTNEQSLLSYSWDFGDGTPSATGGPGVHHTYATPGTFTATFTACDPENACGTSTTQVAVSTRGTTLSYTGVTTSDVTDPATLSASLVDDQGQAVVGRTVSFYADGSSTAFASAATNAAGTASVAFPWPSGSAGTHTVVAKFGGDSMYRTSSFSTAFSVSKDGTILKYTGPASSKPSKSVTLTGSLTDDMFRGLGGLAVTFTLGSQSCTGTTNGSGIASCTIAKLVQNPGNYLVTASFGGNVDYLPSSASTAFKIG
jgi:hypothetical protein